MKAFKKKIQSLTFSPFVKASFSQDRSAYLPLSPPFQPFISIFFPFVLKKDLSSLLISNIF